MGVFSAVVDALPLASLSFLKAKFPHRRSIGSAFVRGDGLGMDALIPEQLPQKLSRSMVVKIAGRRMWLWRAVDDEGVVLDMLVQKRRNTGGGTRTHTPCGTGF